MAKKECKHKNIIITIKEKYHIPKGWDWLQKQEDIDMTEWLMDEQEISTFCEDCGEYLDE